MPAPTSASQGWWMRQPRARNYVEFANRDERYADVEAFLKSPEARKYEGG